MPTVMDPKECIVKVRVNPHSYMAICYQDPDSNGEPVRKVLAVNRKRERKQDGRTVIVWDTSASGEAWVTEEVAREAAGLDHDPIPVDEQDDRLIAMNAQMPTMASIVGYRTKEQAAKGEDPTVAEAPTKRRRKLPAVAVAGEGGEEG